ncbi:dTDP-glucose 4,6-dehydratase [Chitinivibrio alkaliphilus]|uniref:dTDP-glucose 4,6-dehydratase n=1 Tax=Chitinivibrio alkaliphilus ACht1 TaxID=1313304 RepID=U7D4C2_9BACT|nr:dTDP-glucose 4,6-dehydratase [Chitinivibrio alkaliphilus]ERP30813.1 dTDP-glucose 4,6-dehydratase [Chitinivibrio alkaliphilus ACht1]
MYSYLVTGAAGFIGANYLKHILKKHDNITVAVLDKLTYAGNLGTIAGEIKDPRVTFYKGDIGNEELVSHIFLTHGITHVVNFAAESHVDRSIENPQIFLETNILGTQTLLECAVHAWKTGRDGQGYPTYRTGVKFLQVSTDEVYGSLAQTYPEGRDHEEFGTIFGADFFTEDTPLDPHSPYSASKASADLLVQSYADTFHLPVNITRCSNNYGPCHFPEKLIPLMIKNVLEGKKLPVYGDGRNVRDWLYVEDHARAIDLVVQKGRPGEVYNVGGHNEAQNITIVKLIISTVARLMEENPAYQQVLTTDHAHINESLITFVQDRLGHDARYAIDPAKIKKELGWYPETSFEVGIEKTIRWYLENQKWVREVVSGDYQHYYESMYGAREELS